MTRRAAVLVALAASFLPVPAPAADTNVPVARVAAPPDGDAPAASLLRPADLPGRLLGHRLPTDAWQADRLELEAGTVFGPPAALALVQGIFAAQAVRC